jgi:dTDP-4-amino-4,6-dideoxygalactose transaminase
MTNIPFIELSRENAQYKEELLRAASEVFSTGRFILGQKVENLEREIASLIEVKHAVACGSGTDALYLALKALGVEDGDDVITTPFTFFATAAAIARAGARPVFADIDEETLNIDPDSVAARVTPRTRGVIPVHLFGYPAHLSALALIARKKEMFILEDAAQAIGARFKGRPVGSFGDASILSFYPTKNLGAPGDAGMALTDRADVAEKIRLLRNHGSPDAVTYGAIGICSRMDSLTAAVLSIKLPDLAKKNERRRKIARYYDGEFKNLPFKLPPAPNETCECIYHHYTLRSPQRDKIIEHLTSRGAGSGVYYKKTLNVQPCFKIYSPDKCPKAERAASEVFQLPIFPELTDAEVEAVAKAVKSFFA